MNNVINQTTTKCDQRVRSYAAFDTYEELRQNVNVSYRHI